MTKDCLFCKIVASQIPSKKVYEDDFLLAFTDINPQAPIHIVIIPKKHIESLSDASKEDENLLGRIQIAASEIAKQFPEMKDGFRLVNNCGINGGQTVYHIHYHLLGGRAFVWPPG
jgi:histidine triad (HIT) family protein